MKSRASSARSSEALDDGGQPDDAVAATVGIVVRDADQPAVPEPDDHAFAGTVEDLASLFKATSHSASTT